MCDLRESQNDWVMEYPAIAVESGTLLEPKMSKRR